MQSRRVGWGLQGGEDRIAKTKIHCRAGVTMTVSRLTKPDDNLTQKLEEIRLREQKATPGEWEFAGDCCDDEQEDPFIYVQHPEVRNAVSVLFEADWGTTEDADFIAHARQDIPWLLERVEEAYVILKGIELSVEWELAPPIMKAIAEWTKSIDGRGREREEQ